MNINFYVLNNNVFINADNQYMKSLFIGYFVHICLINQQPGCRATDSRQLRIAHTPDQQPPVVELISGIALASGVRVPIPTFSSAAKPDAEKIKITANNTLFRVQYLIIKIVFYD